MLDSTTKQKIDSLRNLLVGKVPDPIFPAEKFAKVKVPKATTTKTSLS